MKRQTQTTSKAHPDVCQHIDTRDRINTLTKNIMVTTKTIVTTAIKISTLTILAIVSSLQTATKAGAETNGSNNSGASFSSTGKNNAWDSNYTIKQPVVQETKLIPPVSVVFKTKYVCEGGFTTKDADGNGTLAVSPDGISDGVGTKLVVNDPTNCPTVKPSTIVNTVIANRYFCVYRDNKRSGVIISKEVTDEKECNKYLPSVTIKSPTKGSAPSGRG